MDKESKPSQPRKWINDSRHNSYESAKSRCESLSQEYKGCETKIRRRPGGHFDVKLWNLGKPLNTPRVKKKKKKKRS